MKIVNKYVPCFLLIVAVNSLVIVNLYAWSGGPPAYRTGAPGDDGTCNSQNCHNSFSLNSGNADFAITGPATYSSGETIKLKVSFKNDSGTLHGFEMTALDANNNRVGKFKSVGNTTQVIPVGGSQGLKEEDAGKYIEHTAAGNKKKSWKIRWTASNNTSGKITFYAAGNDANGNGNPTGDHIYTTTLGINKAAATATPTATATPRPY
ncbi:MAG: hypothetical protein A2Y09_11520 [Planctomycetes bacterium GWA2_39_15]|nr:MAG: hypothetical protein A2Y09_11520 [Planctomycetes bacterium GWA2_39_15]